MQKIIFIMSVLFCFSTQAKCQAPDKTSAQRPEKIYSKVEVEAQFVGGDLAWKSFLQRYLRVNTATNNGAPTGTYRVVVKFVVSRTGTVGAVMAETNHGFGMETEAIRVIKRTPHWMAAINGGHIVSSYRRQPITFVVP